MATITITKKVTDQPNPKDVAKLGAEGEAVG